MSPLAKYRTSISLYAACLVLAFVTSHGLKDRGPGNGAVLYLLLLILVLSFAYSILFRCPKCHYRLSATPRYKVSFWSQRCPKCGNDLRRISN